jgi:hypothetical protein
MKQRLIRSIQLTAAVAACFSLNTQSSTAQTWTEAIEESAPAYWWRFEETSVATPIPNQGSEGSAFDALYGIDIVNTDLQKQSAALALGKGIEFTGPSAGATSEKVVELTAPDDPFGIPELVNFRSFPEDKTTTVEYWIKTSQTGSTGSNTWTSPAILGHESPGDGDLYWGYITANGDFGMSTSDIRELFSQEIGNFDVTDGNWHHIVMIKDWNTDGPSLSTLHIDGGTEAGGVTLEAVTAEGDASFQDDDSAITLVGKVQNGGGGDHQFIGFLDELIVYNRGLSTEEVAAHFNTVEADTDGDGMSDRYELANGLDPNGDDSAGDLDEDGATNIAEFNSGTDPQNPDTDGDGLLDGVETGTGVWVSESDRGTNPFNSDTDGDGLSDSTESNSGSFENADNPGTSPLNSDTDRDLFTDIGEISRGTDPTDSGSKPEAAADWATQIANDNPAYWYRFESTNTSDGLPNEGSVNGFDGVFSEKWDDADLGKESAFEGLGKAAEFTGPPPEDITLFAEFDFLGTDASFVDLGDVLPELTNFRSAPEVKATSVEYWINTSHVATTGDQTWNSPAILSHESPGDGDMYWGWIRDDGDFGFSTSDISEILTVRDTGYQVVDGQWHHVLMVKEWNGDEEPSVSKAYIDGGEAVGGATITATTGPGIPSLQDDDGGIRYLGILEKGNDGNPNVQYIGLMDELAIYDRALDDVDAILHWLAAGGAVPSVEAGEIESIDVAGDEIVITFSGILRSSESVQGPFTPVDGATSPHTTTPEGDQRFYIAQ